MWTAEATLWPCFQYLRKLAIGSNCSFKTLQWLWGNDCATICNMTFLKHITVCLPTKIKEQWKQVFIAVTWKYFILKPEKYCTGLWQHPGRQHFAEIAAHFFTHGRHRGCEFYEPPNKECSSYFQSDKCSQTRLALRPPLCSPLSDRFCRCVIRYLIEFDTTERDLWPAMAGLQQRQCNST